MTTLGAKLRAALTGGDRVDARDLLDRVEALRRYLRTVDPYLPDADLVAAHTLTERAGGRLELSQDHTVVALAGSTGSGKSSLFNALARLTLSPVGVRRPTTGVAHACVWGPLEPAVKLLDWVGVLPRNRYVRESALDGDDEADLRGLVLLDLPDFDSVERAHRLEVDRLLGLVDQVVWVVDPQKYGDRVLHRAYLAQFAALREVTVVVLNQADRLGPADTETVLTDLRRLVEDDGLGGVPVLATSARQPELLDGLRTTLAKTVAGRQAVLRRLLGDLDATAESLAGTVDRQAAEDAVDRGTVKDLATSLAAAAGVPVVAEAAGEAYRHRAAASTGWPVLRGLRRLRPDPLRRLHLGAGPDGGGDPPPGADAAPVPRTSLPGADAAQTSAVTLSVRALASAAGAALPPVWTPAVAAAARSRTADLPDALDRAVATTDLGLSRTPLWWRAVGLLQWLLTLAAVGGLGWLLAGYAVRALGLPALSYPQVGVVPLPTVLLVGGLLAGLLLALVLRPVVGWAARRARRRADQRLRAAVTEVARSHVVAPVREVLRAYAQAREALLAVRRG